MFFNARASMNKKNQVKKQVISNNIEHLTIYSKFDYDADREI